MKPYTRIRALRKQYELTQPELAALLGMTQSSACRLEMADASADFETAMAVEVVFGRPVRELFPHLYARIEDAVMRRAADLESALIATNVSALSPKRRLLHGMVLRAGRNRRDV